MDRATFETNLLERATSYLDELQTSGGMTMFPEVEAMVGFGGDGHKALWWHTKLVVIQCARKPLVRWAALFHDVGKVPTFRREGGKVTFHNHEAMSAKLWNTAAKRSDWFTDEERRYVRFLIQHLGQVEAYLPEWTDSAVRRLGKLVGPHWSDLLILARADITTKHDYKRAAHHKRMTELAQRWQALQEAEAVVPALPKGLGRVLMVELGLEPGKNLGALMGRLRAAVEAGSLPRSGDLATYVAYVKQFDP